MAPWRPAFPPSLAKTPLYSLTTVVGLCATTGTPAVFVVEKGNTIQTRSHGDVVPKTMLRSEGAIAGLFREALGRPNPARNGQGRGKPGRAESSLGGGGICAASATKTLVGGGKSESRREPANLHGAWSALVSRNGRPHTGSERFACLFHKRMGMPSRVSSECVTNSTLKAVYGFWKLITTPAAAPLSATGFPSSSDHTREGATTPAAGGGSL